MRAGVQLSVRKSSGSALAELHVALGVERASGTERGDGRSARADVLTALEHYRPQARAGERERAEHPRRAEAGDDNRRAPRRQARDGVLVGRLCRLALQTHVDSIDVFDRALAPRVQAPALYLQLLYRARPDAELLRREGI